MSAPIKAILIFILFIVAAVALMLSDIGPDTKAWILKLAPFAAIIIATLPNKRK